METIRTLLLLPVVILTCIGLTPSFLYVHDLVLSGGEPVLTPALAAQLGFKEVVYLLMTGMGLTAGTLLGYRALQGRARS